MLTTQQEELFSTNHLASDDAWCSSAGQTRGLLARLRTLLSGQGLVSLELGADHAWRLSVDGLIFSKAGRLASYRPLATIAGLKPSLALDLLSGTRVRLRRDGLAAVYCAGRSFFLPASSALASVPAPPQPFATGDLSWLDPALGGTEFCLVRPDGQFAAAGAALSAMIGPVRHWRFHALIDAHLVQRALRVGPYCQYAFTPARLWMMGKYLSCEIAAESERPAFDPSPLVDKVQSYPVKIAVEPMSSQEWGETLFEYLTLELENNALRIRHHRDLIALRAKVDYQGELKKWRLRSRPLLHALSRGQTAHLYLPERPLDPVGIECAGRWMWILAQQEMPAQEPFLRTRREYLVNHQ